MGRLPSPLAEPEAVYWDLRSPGLVHVVDAGAEKFVVLVDYVTQVERKRTQINTVRTGGRIESLQEFENKGRYAKIL